MSPVSARGLTLDRGGRTLFEDLNLELAPGEAIHVAGPNGSGKSSLLRLVARLLRHRCGTIERVEAALADDMLALDRELPLRSALAFWKGPRLDEAMYAMAIDRLAEVPVRILSTGQAKRARLARVIASGARLWLLDEPVNGLDRDGVDRLAKAIATHRANGGGVIAASHVPLAGDWQELLL